MLPKPRSAEYFDGWYADRVATPTVDEIMNRHMGFPPGTRAGVVPAEAIPELAGELRLTPGSTLLDLACGRGAYGLLIAQKAGTLLIGVDFSAQALTEAREQAARMGVNDASFRLGELTAADCPMPASRPCHVLTPSSSRTSRPAPMTRSAGSSSLAAGWC
jgi:SAM-dependent methyltransferase